MAAITRGFRGRREADPRLPPGQHLVPDWPVMSAGGTPRTRPEDWSFTIRDEDGREHAWDWQGIRRLGLEDVRVDIHCVTHWSKLDMAWRGVPLDALLADVETEARFAMAWCDGGYTTNLPLDELRNGRAWVAFEADGRPLAPEHGGPARLLVPHLYFWKSAKWVRGLTLLPRDAPGFWERAGYHMHGDPWTEERYG